MSESSPNIQILFTLLLMKENLSLDQRSNVGGSKGPCVYPHFSGPQSEASFVREISLLLAFGELCHQRLSSGGYAADKWPF